MRCKRTLCWVLVVTISWIAIFPISASAGMVGTGELLGSQPRDIRQRLQAALSRDSVRKQLEAYGISPQQARERVAGLTDEEIQRLSKHMDTMPAGGDFLGAAVFVFLVLLITDILGYTNVFPFVKERTARSNACER